MRESATTAAYAAPHQKSRRSLPARRSSSRGSSASPSISAAFAVWPEGKLRNSSLRTPAAFNNVFGFRPSLGALPYGPAEEVFLQQYSTCGPMARNVPDLAERTKQMTG